MYVFCKNTRFLHGFIRSNNPSKPKYRHLKESPERYAVYPPGDSSYFSRKELGLLALSGQILYDNR